MLRLITLLLMITPFCAGAQDSLNVKLKCHWFDTSGTPVTTHGQYFNDVWGFVAKGKEYAAIGSTEGVHIIDINACAQVAFASGHSGGGAIHRDYKTYKHYLYAVCDEGTAHLQIYDLDYLPDSLHLVYESDFSVLRNAHNIFIDTAKATLYVCIAKSTFSYDYMRVYSLANPVVPVLLSSYNRHEPVHDVYVRNDTAFCSSSSYGYEVVDFTSHSEAWQNIGELHSYPYQGYNHSSWVNEKGIGVMADETHGLPLKVIDTRNLLNIQVLSTFMPHDDSTCIPHNPYLIGDYAFISYYMDGLQIYDISDPYNPRRCGYYDTYPEASYRGFAGAWGCYPFLPSGKVLVSDMQRGLFVLDATEALKKQDTTSLPDPVFSIYPNPSLGPVRMYLPKSDTGDVSINLFNAAGQKVWEYVFPLAVYTIQPIQLNLPGYLPAGVYFITVMTGAHIYKEKITKR